MFVQEENVISYENLSRRRAEPDHGAVEDATDVQHGAVTSETDEQEAQAVRNRNQHERLLSAQVRQKGSGNQTAD